VLRLWYLIVGVKRLTGFSHDRATMRTNQERVKPLPLVV
jgi:hypothetical protein